MLSSNAITFRCSYCARDKPVAERSLEHLWPCMFGGSHSPDWFKTRDVCQACNNLVGLYVDAEFGRSLFGTSLRLSAHLPFIDIRKPHPLPLVYLGRQTRSPAGAEVCENWAGPRGEVIYFFHGVDRSDFDTYAAGDPIRRKTKDPGRVYFGLTKRNTFWIYTAIESIKAKFEGAEIRSLTTFSDGNFVKQFTPETSQSEIDRNYVSPLWKKRTQDVNQVLHIDYGVRFQAKLALGFGHALFGPKFADQQYAETLRQGLWHRVGSGREPPRLVGKNFWQPDDAFFTDRFSSAGAFTLMFSKSFEGTWISAFLLNQKSISSLMLPAGQTLSCPLFERFTDHFVVLIYPALDQFIGPIPAVSYVMHRRGTHTIPELEAIEVRIKTIQQIEDELAKYNIDADQAA